MIGQETPPEIKFLRSKDFLSPEFEITPTTLCKWTSNKTFLMKKMLKPDLTKFWMKWIQIEEVKADWTIPTFLRSHLLKLRNLISKIAKNQWLRVSRASHCSPRADLASQDYLANLSLFSQDHWLSCSCRWMPKLIHSPTDGRAKKGPPTKYKGRILRGRLNPRDRKKIWMTQKRV